MFKWGDTVDYNHITTCVIAAAVFATIVFNYERHGFSWTGLISALICLAAIVLLAPDYYVAIRRGLKKRQ